MAWYLAECWKWILLSTLQDHKYKLVHWREVFALCSDPSNTPLCPLTFPWSGKPDLYQLVKSLCYDTPLNFTG